VGASSIEDGGGGLAGQDPAEIVGAEDFDVRAEGEQSFGGIERPEAQLNRGPVRLRPGSVGGGAGPVS
jgi:hypothetical protein